MNLHYTQFEPRLLEFMKSETPDDAAFNACALEVYRFQRAHNRPYDNYCKHLGALVELQDWKQIPAVPQSAFKQTPLCAFSESETTTTFRTSGTTGEGFGSHHFRSTLLYDEAILRGWDFFGLPLLPQIILTPTPSQAPHSSLSHMMGTLKARAGGGEQHFCVSNSGDLQIEKIHSLLHSATAPVLLMGTALAFLHLFEKGNLPMLPPGSQAMETGGYKGSGRSLSKAELYALFTKHLGLPPDSIINEYGMTELSSQFYTRGLGNPHHAPPWMRTLVIDPETDREVPIGETGVLRIFDLANLGSVLALQTQDLAVRHASGFVLIGRDPSALPRGCSRSADEMLSRSTTAP